MSLDELRTRTSEKWVHYPADVLPLWVAEMDVEQAEPVVRAVSDAVRRGDTGYHEGGGDYADAFAAFADTRWDWTVDASTVRSVAAVMEGIAEVIRALTAPTGAVVVNTPVYPRFFDFVRHTGRVLVDSPLDEHGRLDFADLDRAFALASSTGSAAFVLCHPHNPHGTLHSPDELRAVGELAERHGVRVISDEIHAALVLDGEFTSAVEVIPSAVALHSASKAFNLAGLKAALVVPGADAVADVAALHPIVTNAASHLGAIAQATAFRHCGSWLDDVLVELRANRSLLRTLLDERAPAIRWEPGAATYLAWLDLAATAPAVEGRSPVAAILHRGRVALSPGEPFGALDHHHARLNYATPAPILTEAVERIASAL